MTFHYSWDIANEMEIEDGVIWVYGVGENGVQAFTDFGNENLIELIRFYKENPGLFKRQPCGLRRMDTADCRQLAKADTHGGISRRAASITERGLT